MTSRAAVALLLVALAAVPLSGATEETSGEATTDTEAPVARQQDVLFVAESLPFMPASNTVLTKLPTATAWTPANVGVVGLDLIEAQGAEILGDALENVSGLNVQTGNGVFDFFVLRGFDSLSSGLVLIDGAPEPEASFYQLYNTERVEVFKGPAGFLYGSNSLAGVVNLVRKQPVPTDFGGASLSLGSWDALDAALDLNRASADGAVSFRVNSLYRRGDGHRDGRDFEVAAVNPALTWRPGERTTVHLNLEALSSDYTPDAGLPLLGSRLPASVPRTRSYASPFDFSDQDLVRLQLDVEHRLGDNTVLRSKSYLRTLDWRTDGTLLNGVLEGFSEPLVARSLLLLDDRQNFVGTQAELVLSASSGAIEHRILAGVEVARQRDEYGLDVALLPTINLVNPVEIATRPLFILPGQSARGDSRATIVAPYVVDQMELGAKVQLLAGLRWDSIEFDDDATATSRADGEISPMLGLVVAPRDDLALYANLGRSFAPPSARVAGERRPERSRQIELGLRKTFADERLRTTFALFELERDNIAIPDDTGFTQQAGDQRSRGLELELAARLPGQVDLTLAYAYTDSRLTRFAERVIIPFPEPVAVVFDRSGNRSAFAPENLLNAWIAKRAGRWTLGAGLRMVDEQFIAEDNATAIDGYVLVDAMASYRRGEWRLRLGLENVTDEAYETRGFGTSAVIPGRPLAVTVGIDYRL